jgi:hypothetical protein
MIFHAAVAAQLGSNGSMRIVRSYGKERTCATVGCGTKLSQYNSGPYCACHEGAVRQTRMSMMVLRNH